jgi:hypothetical protein
MIRKYKLIQIYPDSPPLGTEVEYNGQFYQTKITHKCTVYSYNTEQIKNFPQFWQEVKEVKEYKLRHKKTGLYLDVYNYDTEISRPFSIFYRCKESDFEKMYEKIPLFTTEDNVEIFEGDIFWFVDTMWNIGMGKATSAHKHISEYKTFSTKEAAEKYVDENKPVFSRKQIEQSFNYMGVGNKNPFIFDRIKDSLMSILDNKLYNILPNK